MEIAAVHAIAELAQAEQNEVVAAAYADSKLAIRPEHLIPKPFDPRLMIRIAPAGGQGGGRFGRSRCGRSPTSTPNATSCRPSSMPRARR
jgi:hypothetical protein